MDFCKKMISAFAKNKSNKYLNFPNSQLSLEQIIKICKNVKNDAIEYLNLSGNNIDSDGIKCIVDVVFKFKSLKVVNLDDNCIGNEGFKYIVDALEHNNTLQIIDFRNNNITNINDTIIGGLIKIIQTNNNLNCIYFSNIKNVNIELLEKFFETNTYHSCSICETGILSVDKFIMKLQQFKLNHKKSANK